MEFIKYLVYSLASNDETIDHLENLYETESLKDAHLYQYLHQRLCTLGKKINLLLCAVDKNHLSPK